MGYYDFEEHFWAPHEVCAQTLEPVNDTRFVSLNKIVKAILAAFGGDKYRSKTLVSVEASHRHLREEG